MGERLRRLRLERRLSLEEAARQMQMSWSALAMYERNERTPSVERLVMLADFYSVSTDFLLGRSEQRSGAYPARPSLAALPAFLRETGEASEEAIRRALEALGKAGAPIDPQALYPARRRGRPPKT